MLSWAPRPQSRTVLAVLLWLAFTPPAGADSKDVNALRREIQQLRGVVEGLDARVRALEQQRPEPAASQSGAITSGQPPGAPAIATPGLRDRWQRVKRGMTTQEVETLLGRPTRTMKLTPKTIWYYSYTDIGNGSVVFTDDSVIDWQSPPLNAWWGF
jgi:hypothetical protein